MLQCLCNIRLGNAHALSIENPSANIKLHHSVFVNQNINHYLLFERFPFFPQYRPLYGDHNHFSPRASLSWSRRSLLHLLCPCLAISAQLISHHFKTLLRQISNFCIFQFLKGWRHCRRGRGDCWFEFWKNIPVPKLPLLVSTWSWGILGRAFWRGGARLVWIGFRNLAGACDMFLPKTKSLFHLEYIPSKKLLASKDFGGTSSTAS